VGEHPEEAARALSSIEETSRGALREMRALLGVLRAEEDEALVPAPGLADLKGLVDRSAEAGVRVHLDVRGDRPRLSAGLDLAAYRVVQEALTNVIKHAAASSAQVTISYRPDSVTVEITDQGSSGPPGSGHGIIGMRERVAVFGGEFAAGPGPDGGFRVRACFPIAKVTS